MVHIQAVEFKFATQKEHQQANNGGIGTVTVPYTCGGCGKSVQGRIVASAVYQNPAANHHGIAYWCLYPCGEPTVLKVETAPHNKTFQSPRALEFTPGAHWPPDLERLFMEASAAFSASAYTACAMVSRKILMAVACKNGDDEGKNFTTYVDFIINNVVTIPNAKNAIDAIRTIGNEANHDVKFVDETEARRSLEIARYVLSAAYSLPSM